MHDLEHISTSAHLLVMLADVSLKSAALAALATFGLRLSGPCTPSVRHSVWMVVLAGMLLMPLADLVLPAMAIPVSSLAVPLEAPTSLEPVERGNREPHPEQPSAPHLASVDAIDAVQDAVPDGRRISWFLVSVVLYLAVAACFGLWLVAGFFTRRSALRCPTPIDPARLDAVAWPRSRCRASLFESSAISVPVVVGCFRPAILLPIEWSSWSDAKLGSVLAHERAHVARFDYAFLMLALVNRCVFWFHPAAWIVLRRISDAAELACDEAAIEAGSSPREYTRYLLEIASARGSARGRFVVAGPAMASRTQLGRRIDTILARESARERMRSAIGGRWLAASMVALAACSAGLRLRVPATTLSGVAASEIDAHAALAVGRTNAVTSPQQAGAAIPPAQIATMGAARTSAAPAAEITIAATTPEFVQPPPSAPSDIAGLDGLFSPDPRVRARAAEDAGRATDGRAVPALIAMLGGDDDWIARMQAAQALGRLGDASAIEPLVKALREPNGLVRQQAADSLGRLDSQRSSVLQLIAVLRDENAIARMQAARALGRLRDGRAIAPLIVSLEDTNNIVRQLAAESLADLRARSAVVPLIDALADTSANVRQAAAESLGTLGDDRAVDALLACSHDSNSFVRDAASRSLDRLTRDR